MSILGLITMIFSLSYYYYKFKNWSSFDDSEGFDKTNSMEAEDIDSSSKESKDINLKKEESNEEDVQNEHQSTQTVCAAL